MAPRPNRRLFLALWPDAAGVDALAALIRDLRAGGVMRGRPVDEDRLHLTLFHLGDVIDAFPPGLVPAVQAACAARGARESPFEVRFDHVAGRGGPLLLRASDPLAGLRAFHAGLAQALAQAGVALDDRAFLPHVTLSYDRGEVPETPVTPLGWRVRGFDLVESLLGRHRHVRLGRWPLTG
jgi:RNA 2',3'-cyclic 3'-phosphodiesterase